MLIGIIKDFRHNNNSFIKIYSQILRINDIPFKVIDINVQSDFLDHINDYTHFIFRFGQYPDEKNLATSIMPVLYAANRIKCFPDYATSWHYDNKISQYYLLKNNGFPVIDTVIFWNKEIALKYLDTEDYPIVIKLSTGAGSSNVKLLKSKKEARKIAQTIFSKGYSDLGFQYSLDHFTYKKIKSKLYNLLFSNNDYWLISKNYILIQKYLPDNHFDTRIVTVGNRAIGFIRHNRPEDFRASGSGKFNLDPLKVNKKCLSIAFEVSMKLKFQTMAYDFLFDENGDPKICEISYTFSFGKPYTECPGYWDENLVWHDGKNWLEYYQLIDLLEAPDLKRLEVE